MNMYDLILYYINNDADVWLHDKEIVLDENSNLVEKEKKIIQILNKILNTVFRISDGDLIVITKNTDNNDSLQIGLTMNEYDLLKNINISLLPLSLQCLLSDILWLKYQEWEFAKNTYEKLIEYYENYFDINIWTMQIEYLHRAIKLVYQFNNKKAIERIHHVVIKQIDNYSFSNGILCIKLLSFINAKKIDANTKNSFLNILNSIIENNLNDLSLVEKSYELKLKFSDSNSKKTVQLDKANYFIKRMDALAEDSFQNVSIKLKYFYKAYELYKNNQENELARNVRNKIEPLELKLPTLMQSFECSIDITNLVHYLNDVFDNLSFEQILIRAGFIIRFKSAEEIIDKIKQCSNLSDFFPSTIVNEYGQTIGTVEGNNSNNSTVFSKDKIFHETLKAIEEDSIIYLILFRILKENYQGHKRSIELIFENNPLVPEGREQIFANGLSFAFEGLIYESLHILAPQMENYIRNLVKECGDFVTYYDNSIISYKTLDSLLDSNYLKESLEPNCIFTYKCLLSEKMGGNIRNEIAHGLMSSNQSNSAINIYFILIVLRTFIFMSPYYLNLLKSNQELKKLKKPEEPLIKLD